MKKFILFAVIAILGTSVHAEVNLPGAPSFGTSDNATTSVPSSAYKKQGYQTPTPNLPSLPKVEEQDPLRAELDGIAMNILRAAEKHDNALMNQHFQKLVTRGNVETYYQPTILSRPAGCPYKKSITVNGRKLSGNTCAYMGYEYKGKMREVGYCK